MCSVQCGQEWAGWRCVELLALVLMDLHDKVIRLEIGRGGRSASHLPRPAGPAASPAQTTFRQREGDTAVISAGSATCGGGRGEVS